MPVSDDRRAVAPADRRARLDAREAELVRALHGGTTPSGLEAEMIALASAGITRKRQRQLAKIFPALVHDLGATHPQRFTEFARANPPQDGGAIADGLRFGRAIAREQALSKTATIELMVINSTVRLRRSQLRPRRAPYLALTLIKRPAALILIVRLPGLGLKVIST